MLLFVSVKVAVKHLFRQYACRLYDTGNLDRFMIDKCQSRLDVRSLPQAYDSAQRATAIPGAVYIHDRDTAAAVGKDSVLATLYRRCKYRSGMYQKVESPVRR